MQRFGRPVLVGPYQQPDGVVRPLVKDRVPTGTPRHGIECSAREQIADLGLCRDAENYSEKQNKQPHYLFIPRVREGLGGAVEGTEIGLIKCGDE